MSTPIKAPAMGESISEATVVQWLKKEGDFVEEDAVLAELETDKVNLEVTAPKSGKLLKVISNEGDVVAAGDVMGELEEAESAPEPEAEQPSEEPEEPKEESSEPQAEQEKELVGEAAKQLAEEHDLDLSDIRGTGREGRVTKGDVLAHIASQKAGVSASSKENEASKESEIPEKEEKETPQEQSAVQEKKERREPLSRIRKTIAHRLKQAQNTAAMLTTYNEIDLHEVMTLRKDFQEDFVAKNGIKLGFMSFFTKAVVHALQEIPALNAEITDEEIIYKNYYDIGIAVSSPRGLVVPVVRTADQKTFAEIEKEIKGFGEKATKGTLMPDDMVGATFTITNGGTFGSMLSMPILNYPQVGILGMHAIKERPVVVEGEIKIRPIMYVALTYDHRIVDGKEAVTFLVKIKEMLENPNRMLIGV